MPVNNDLYLPILVGANTNYKKGIDYQQDNIGDNISDKNSNYSELTALYWAWKNLPNTNIIGLVHYRRYFFKKYKKNNLNNIIDKKDIQKLLNNHDVILPKKRNYFGKLQV